jgi:xanthosine utilization system XapX-like protein
MEGYQLGAAAMNITLTGGSLLLVMAIGVVLTYPDIPAWPLIAIVGGVALLVGIGGYPMSYTIWLAVDLTMNHLSEEEIADAAQHATKR